MNIGKKTNAERVLELINANPEGLTDGQIARQLNLNQATPNAICRQLAGDNHIIRINDGRGIINKPGTSQIPFVQKPRTSDKVLELIKLHPSGITDAEIARSLAINQAAANMAARALAQKGLIERVRPGSVYLNRPTGLEPLVIPLTEAVKAPDAAVIPSESNEATVQAKVVRHLVENGWEILRVAHTDRREHGRDIEARKNGKELWITVKGYPKGTEKTQAGAQARVWFAGALMDIIFYRNENPDVELWFALPDKSTYRKLAERCTWFMQAARAEFFWVSV